MVKRYKGGLMGGTEATTSSSDARGMWGTVQAIQARNTGNWPGLLVTETPGSGSGAGFANAFMTVSNVSVTDSNYTVLNDTPNISTAGGYIKITGRGFVSGCVVYVGGTPATSTTFISSTEVRAQIAAATSNTLMVYVVNPDGSTGIKLNSLVFSGTPTWTTDATLTSQVTDVLFSISFAATSDSAVTYTLNTGSTLPPGTSLFANGLFTGTVTGLSSDTTYSFSVLANDAENQDTARTFSVTFGIGDSGFPLTSSIFNSDGNNWVRDASANNAFTTVGNDTRPTAFSPYNSNWSGLFDGTGDSLSTTSTAVVPGSSNFTVECWIYPIGTQVASAGIFTNNSTGGLQLGYYSTTGIGIAVNGIEWSIFSSVLPTVGVWNHVVFCRGGTGTNQGSVFLNGTRVANGTVNANFTTGTTFIGYAASLSYYFNGYISQLRYVSSDVYGFSNTTITVPTAPLTAILGTQLLTCNSNRFVDNSPNASTITRNGDVAIRSFAPFAESDLITGSAYFDGTGDHLIITDNAGMELGAGDFCVECWIYPTSVAGTGVVIDKRSGGYAPLLLWRSSSTLQIYMSLNGSSWGLANAVTVGALVVNQWYHVAVFRVGTSLYTSFNGVVSLVTASGSGTLVNNATNWYIGTETNGSTNPWTGYIADMRFVVGSGVYTSANFTPATSSLTSVANTQFLSLQYRTGENNHRFVDESGLTHIITRNGDTYQGTFSPFSPAGWSAYFDGTGDYLTFPELNISSSTSFTIEFWFYWSASPSTYSMFVSDDNGNSSKYIAYNVTSATLEVQTGGSAGTTAYCSFTPILNTWYHLAFVRNTNTVTIYVNGVAQAMTQATQSGTFLDQGTINYIGRWGGTTPYAVTGYMSNFRAVVGLAVYTGNFTTPTSILGNTQSSGSNIAAITSGSTFLSLQNNRFVDNGINASAITRNGDAKIQAFSPFRNSGTYTPATHGGSVYLDGSGDYVYVTTSPAMTLGTNNHCIEFWMYPDGTQAIYACPWYYDGSIVYYFSVGSNSNESFLLVGGGSPWSLAITILSAEYLKVLNNWTHVVITRTGTAFRVIFNGRLVGYGTTAQSIAAPNPTFSIGWDLTNATTLYKGWLSNFRIINGSVPTAYQTASTTLGTTIFTPPTSVPAFEANTVMAMNFTNGGIVDATGRTVMETVGTVKVSNVASKFGLGSLFFDGTAGNRLQASSTVAPANFNMGTGDYTVEFWMYSGTPGSQQCLFDFRNADVSGQGIAINYKTDRALVVYMQADRITSSAISANTWTHVAVVRASGTYRLYVNGVSAGTWANSDVVAPPSNRPYIGAVNDGTQVYNGYIDDLRITRFARYTGASLTVPTGPFLTK